MSAHDALPERRANVGRIRPDYDPDRQPAGRGVARTEQSATFLGIAKTRVEQTGVRLMADFRALEDSRRTCAEEGITVEVVFNDPVVQTAYDAFLAE